MPTSNVRSGKCSATLSSPVPDGIAAVIATTFSSRAISAASALANTRRVARRARRGLGLDARNDVELDHAVIFVGAVLGRARSPCPSWSRHGPASARHRRRGRSRAPRPARARHARRPARRNKSPAPRTASRRSASRGYIPRPCARQRGSRRASPARASARRLRGARYLLDDTSRASALRSEPTGGAIDMSLSLRITTSRLPAASALFIAS